MDHVPDLKTVEQAISTFYKSPATPDSPNAAQWLANFQKTVYAWKIADELLHQKRSLENCFFAAQTMHVKIQRNFLELPIDSHVSLRDSLIGHILEFSREPNYSIMNQLVLALSDLAIQTNQWPNFLYDLVDRFVELNPLFLLTILTIIPEEVDSKYLKLGNNRRSELYGYFRNCSRLMLDLFKRLINTSGELEVQWIKCLASWMTFSAISIKDIVTEPILIEKLFRIVENLNVDTKLHDAATDCICSVLQCLEENDNESQFEIDIFKSVGALEKYYHFSVANEDDEKMMNFCRIFTELAFTYLSKILVYLPQEHYAIKSLELVLLCVGNHDYQVAELTFNFWYKLSEDVFKIDPVHQKLFIPFVERLIYALTRHCHMDADNQGLLDDQDDFRDFRSKVSELVFDIVYIVGLNNCFQKMFGNLQTQTQVWEDMEATLFIMSTIAKNISKDESNVVSKVIEAIIRMPDNVHIALRYTSIILLGELSNWINKNPETLGTIIHFLIVNIQQEAVMKASAKAITNITLVCAAHLQSQISILLQMISFLDTNALSLNEMIGLIRGLAYTIGFIEDRDLLTTSFRELCILQIEPLCMLIDEKNNVTTSVRDTATDPIVWLDRISGVFQNINVNLQPNERHPCLPVVDDLWHVLIKVLNRYQSDVKVMERCNRCFRFIVRSMSSHIKHLIMPLIEHMVQLYRVYKHSCFLYLGSILIDEYGTDHNLVKVLRDMLEAILPATFELLKDKQGLENHPATVDDFFRLCTRFVQRSPLHFLESKTVGPIIGCAIHSCSLEHRDANLSIMRFFIDFIKLAISDPYSRLLNEEKSRKIEELAAAYVVDFSPKIIASLLHASIVFYQSSLMSDVSDVLLQLMEFDRKAFEHWLSLSLEEIINDFKTNSASKITTEQLKYFHTTVTRAKSIADISYALKTLMQLYR